MAASLQQLISASSQPGGTPAGAPLIRDSGTQQLREMTLDELLKQQGQIVAPQTPGIATQLGANPDVAKMVGTPAQKQAAQTKQLATGTSLEERQAITPNNLTTSQAQDAERLRQQQLKTAGNQLNAQVDAAAQAQLNQQLVTAQPGQVHAAPKTGFTPQQTANLTALAQEPSSASALAGLNETFGRGAANPLTAEEIRGMFQPGSEADLIGQAVAGAVDASKVNGSTLDWKAMGMEDGQAQAEELLGLPHGGLANLSLEQVNALVNSQVAQATSQVDSLTRQANDGSLGARDRAEAQLQLRDLGYAGLTQNVNNLDRIYQQIADPNAQKITFEGEEVTPEQLLSDDYLSGITAKYLEGGDFAKQLAKDHPELTQFIDSNRAALTAASASLDQSVKDLASIQFDNLHMGSTSVGDVDSGLVKDWVPELQNPNIARARIAPPPILQLLNDTAQPNASKLDLKQLIDTVEETDRNAAVALGKMSANDLIRAGYTNHDSAGYKQLVKQSRTHQLLAGLQPSDRVTLSQILGFGSDQELTDTYNELQQKAASGLYSADQLGPFAKLLSGVGISAAPGTGWTADNWDKLYASAQAAKGDYAKEGLLSQVSGVFQAADASAKQDELFDKVKFAFANDAHIDANEWSQIDEGTREQMRGTPLGRQSAGLLDSLSHAEAASGVNAIMQKWGLRSPAEATAEQVAQMETYLRGSILEANQTGKPHVAQALQSFLDTDWIARDRALAKALEPVPTKPETPTKVITTGEAPGTKTPEETKTKAIKQANAGQLLIPEANHVQSTTILPSDAESAQTAVGSEAATSGAPAPTYYHPAPTTQDNSKIIGTSGIPGQSQTIIGLDPVTGRQTLKVVVPQVQTAYVAPTNALAAATAAKGRTTKPTTLWDRLIASAGANQANAAAATKSVTESFVNGEKTVAMTPEEVKAAEDKKNQDALEAIQSVSKNDFVNMGNVIAVTSGNGRLFG